MAASVSMANQPALRAAVTVLFEDGWCLSGSASCQVAARSTPPTSVDTWLQNNLFFAYRQTAYTERMMDVQPTSDQSVTKLELMCSGCAGQRVFFLQCKCYTTRLLYRIHLALRSIGGATRSVANVSHHGMLVKHEDEVIELVAAFSIG